VSDLPAQWRKTTQEPAPAHHSPTPPGHYDIYPAFPLAPGLIEVGYAALAKCIEGYRRVIIDGYGGVLWSNLRAQLDAALQARGVNASWIPVDAALRSEQQIAEMVQPFLGGEDPLFGTRFTGNLCDFFDTQKLASLQPDLQADVSVIYGCGAALAGWDGLIVYVDVPKNEIQFRARAGSVTNLGITTGVCEEGVYKRFYFVDWVTLNRHKSELLPRIDVIVDEQRPCEPAIMAGSDLRTALHRMSRNYFRVRPWFEPGPWGGQWIKQNMPDLPQDAPNYAWSFELISPENGLAFSSDNKRLEVSFDMLTFQEHEAVLGESADRFGYEFPIRFDFLDTFAGGNLSVQCHPRPGYIRRNFGESFTQDECYYILDCEPGARVFLGFRDDIDPQAFRAALEASAVSGEPVDVERFVNTEPAHKHDLFLIPHGTIHCSGVDNLVLEISATPYIFTFKMFDWVRRDLDGKMRPLNIKRAFDNLSFERKGERVRRELLSRPEVVATGPGWQIVHLPTHADHFYDVERLEFDREIQVATERSAQVMSLVEGEWVILETARGMKARFNHAETFVAPAAAGDFRLINGGNRPAKVVKAFVKPLSSWTGKWYDTLRAGD